MGCDECRRHGQGVGRRSTEIRGTEEDSCLPRAGLQRLGDGNRQGHSLQLDGHDRGSAGACFSLDSRQGRGDVAAHSDVLCAGTRTLDRQHVCRSCRNDVRRSRVNPQLALVESAPRDSREHCFWLALDWSRPCRQPIARSNPWLRKTQPPRAQVLEQPKGELIRRRALTRRKISGIQNGRIQVLILSASRRCTRIGAAELLGSGC